MGECYELIGLCEDILEDAEVTVDEVGSLGKWFAAHEEDRKGWPGTVLAKPVDDVLLDGKVNKTELRKIATLLRKVQKEWVKRREDGIQQAMVDSAAAAARTVNLARPFLPSIPVTLGVKSHSDDNVLYQVDLTGPSCSCPDWVGGRRHLPQGSLSRCCKHVLDAYSRVRPSDGWPGWIDVFLENGWRPHPDRQWVILRLGTYPMLLAFGGTDWADVFAVYDGAYQRFGFNTVERRWSYGREPEGHRQIEAQILGPAEKPPGFFRRLFGG